MAYPEKPVLTYSYTGFSTGQGDNSFPGSQVDADLANLKTSVDAIVEFLAATFRSDLKLANETVTRDSLASDLLLGLAAPRAWETGTDYDVDDTVTSGSGLYIALVDHTSSSDFLADVGVGRWQRLIDLAAPLPPPDGSVTTAKIVDAAVTGPKIAGNAITATHVADGALPLAKLSGAGSLNIPIGLEADYAGIEAPTGWLFEFGQAVDRTTYSALFGALTKAGTGDFSVGSTTIANVNADLRNKGLIGSVVEATGVTPGTTITAVAATTITLSSPATSAATTRPFRIFPHGNGNGVSTFGIPDGREIAYAGRGDMGGTAVTGRLTPTMEGARLGNRGGVAAQTLSIAQLPAFTPTGNVLVTYPPHTYVNSLGASQNLQAGAAGTTYSVQLWGFSNDPTTPPAAVSHAITMNSIGSGTAHNNIQPTGIRNKIIYAGV